MDRIEDRADHRADQIGAERPLFLDLAAYQPARLDDAAILDLVDRCAGRLLHQQAGHLLAALAPDLSDAECAAVPLGDRDRFFWAYKRQHFSRGVQMMARVHCASCGTEIALDLASDIQLPDRVADFAEVDFAGQIWRISLPVQGDFDRSGISNNGDFGTRLCPAAPWDQPEFQQLAQQALDDADPGMDVVLDVVCPDCGGVTASRFDPFAFVWSDVTTRAARVLEEVALLAQAFGWRETDTLALSPMRRARYLEMLQ